MGMPQGKAGLQESTDTWETAVRQLQRRLQEGAYSIIMDEDERAIIVG